MGEGTAPWQVRRSRLPAVKVEVLRLCRGPRLSGSPPAAGQSRGLRGCRGWAWEEAALGPQTARGEGSVLAGWVDNVLGAFTF